MEDIISKLMHSVKKKKILLYNEFIPRWLLTIYGTLICVVVLCAFRLRSKLIS